MAIAVDAVDEIGYAATDQVDAELISTAPDSAPPPPSRKRPRHHWARWALAIGFATAVAVSAVLWHSYLQNQISYQTVLIERGPIQASVTATGTLNAVVDVQVGSQVSGNIKALYADYNTKVTKGQLVALIDPEVFQTQVDQAQAALGSVQSAVITAGAQVVKANADVSGTIANEKSVESMAAKDRANALNAKMQWERLTKLFGEGAHFSARSRCGQSDL